MAPTQITLVQQDANVANCDHERRADHEGQNPSLINR